MILLSADVGEGADADAELLSLLDCANVCCGVHAGSAALTIATALRCRDLGVEVVAHPGYDDRPSFGRAPLTIDNAEIERLVAFQVAALRSVAQVYFVKPHGALYHRCQEDRGAAEALLRAVAPFACGVVGQPGMHIVEAARAAGVPFRREAFADRAYGDGGKLVGREASGAVLTARQAARQAERWLEHGGVETLCVHADSEGSVQVARAVRSRLDERPH